MLKTIATFTALATLAAVAIAPAHAGWGNGISLNGEFKNGEFKNGEFKNGEFKNGAADGSSTLTIQAIELPPETR